MSELDINTYIQNVEIRLNYLKDKKRDDSKMLYLEKILSATTKLINQLDASKKTVNQKRKGKKPERFIDEQPTLFKGKYDGRKNDKYDQEYNMNRNTKTYRQGRYLKDFSDGELSDDSFIVNSDEEESESGSGSESESEIGSESESESNYGGKKNKKTLKNVKTIRRANSRKTVRKRSTKKDKGKKNNSK
jgi:hypothetical protein